MDQVESRPMGPVGDVLFLPELLEKILDYCSHSDQKQLLNCRLVCSFWRDCAFSVFASNLSIVPRVNLENRKLLDWSVEPEYKKYCEMVQPQSFLPVNAFMRYSDCDMLPVKFLQDYSSNMVTIVAYDLMVDSALQVTQFPQLRKLIVDSFLLEDTPIKNLREYFKTKCDRLVELILNLDYYHIELGEMPNLKALKLGHSTSVSGTETQPLSKLLPNLKHISFGLSGYLAQRTTAIHKLISSGTVFSNVDYLEVHVNWSITNEKSELIVDGLVNCFPNTKKLLWDCCMSSLQLTLAIQTVFSRLKYLTSLRIGRGCTTAKKILRLLTNLSVEEIPEDEENWDDALVDGTKTLCNLKFLRTLILENGNSYNSWDSSLELPELESRFLLKAVFMKMDNLRKISFGHITYNAGCIRAWRDSGREFETITRKIEEDKRVYLSYNLSF